MSSRIPSPSNAHVRDRRQVPPERFGSRSEQGPQQDGPEEKPEVERELSQKVQQHPSGLAAAAAAGATHATGATTDVAAAPTVVVAAAAGRAADGLCTKGGNIARRGPFQRGADVDCNRENIEVGGSNGFAKER
eukprot:jgi/Undpi1/11522/HiC_scaffold_30.g13819.m1